MSKGLDAYHGHHTLRERGKKAHIGILVIRFELPYNIWCEGCKNHVGMGVRYNAEKKKVGQYYSTPVYEFKMKCHLCNNYITIKTDPANLDYEIVSGARRQENRWDPTQNEQIVPETKETQRRLFDDAMFKLEHGSKDQKAAQDAKPNLCRLYQRNDGVWKDCFEANSRLRAEFRETKKQLKATEDADNKILSRTSLSGSDLKLLPESQEDRQLAGLLKLHSTKSIAENSREKMKKIMEKPMLPSAANLSKSRVDEKINKLKVTTNLGIVRIKKTENDQKRRKIATETKVSLVKYSSSSSNSENDDS